MRNLLAMALLLAMATVASATIVVDTNPGNFPGDQNVLFQVDSDTPGSPLLGELNQTGELVQFDSTSALVAPSQGQARIESNTSFTDLDFQFANATLFFTTAIFNVDATANSELNLQVQWQCATGQTCGGSPSGTFMNTYSLGQNGQNFIRIQAIDGQLIRSVAYNTTADVDNVSQIRIGGVSDIDGPGGDPVVPEPMSISLLGGGLLAIGLLRKFAKN